MAMAKFVFRSLAREHPEPGDFLAAANEVVVGEVALGKFITMVYVTVDRVSGGGAAALPVTHGRGSCAARPVEPLEAGGLALGIDAGQTYDEVAATLAARRRPRPLHGRRHRGPSRRVLYGEERLDAVLAAHACCGRDEVAELWSRIAAPSPEASSGRLRGRRRPADLAPIREGP